MEGISVSSKEMLWSSLGKHLRKLGYPVDIKDSDDFLGEFYTQKKWGRPLVIFFDEFDALFSDGAAEACSSMLSTIRTIRNDPNRWTTGAVHSIVSIGTYAILQLNQTNRALSPFNISDNFRNTSLSRDQVRELFHEFADDRDTSIDDNVIENIFVKTGGLGTLSGGRHIDMDYLGSVEDTLLINMREYGTFVRLDRDLRGRSEMQKAALEYYRSCFLGNPSDKAVFVGMSDNRNLAEYLAALGALNPGSDGCFYIASPLMDSFIRQIVIPAAFPGAPNIPPPLRSDGSLDVLEVIKSALRLFDKDLISRAHELSYKEAHVVVDKGKKQRVPRESIYDSELIRILMNWLALRTGYGVVGQHHIQNLFCDVMVKVGQQDPVPIELVVTETQRLVQAHIDKTNNYRRLIGASEGWVIHLTREDNYLQNPLWPTDEMLDQGVYMIHVWHDKSFTEVRLSAKWRNLDGRVVSVENERVV
ncbi:hypothetical protein EDD11_005445 [Mortierella claussenii]|nr:hypothetical protein EDD11_005445 [Mortierella claussenii]